MLTQQGQIAPEGFLTISPAGDRLAFRIVTEGAKPNTTKIRILDLTTRQVRDLPVDVQISALVFSELGMSIDYVENVAAGARIWRRTVDSAAEPRLIAEVPGSRVFAIAWSEDGKTLTLSRGRQDNDAILLTNF
jgi:Tol biopolymer transport system component